VHSLAGYTDRLSTGGAASIGRRPGEGSGKGKEKKANSLVALSEANGSLKKKTLEAPARGFASSRERAKKERIVTGGLHHFQRLADDIPRKKKDYLELDFLRKKAHTDGGEEKNPLNN